MSSSSPITRRQALRRVGALLGGIVSAPTVAGVLSGCRRSTTPDWTPETLSEEQNRMVDTLSDIILPPTDTPGASDAHVNRFIDAMLTTSPEADDRNRFLSGLDDLNARCKDKYDADFLSCTQQEQVAIVAKLDGETFGDGSPDRDDPPFFRMLKEMVLVGYYTSEIGATEELKTNIVPGHYDGNVPYEEIGRAWSGAAS